MNLDDIKTQFNLSANSLAIVKKMLTRKGQFTHVKYMRPLKFRKAFEESNYGFKEVVGVFSLGKNYENLASTINKRNEGISASGLNGKEWVKFPYLIVGANQNLMTRLYAVRNTKVVTSFYLNGKKVEPDELEPFCLASELDLTPRTVFDLRLDYIKELY
jgi:hypothetical protein